MKQLQEILKPYFVEGQTDYDITAVETLFIEKLFTILVHKNCYEVRGKGILDGKEYFDVFYGNFPRKPLHLYTEEEDKNLLELLQKIGKK